MYKVRYKNFEISLLQSHNNILVQNIKRYVYQLTQLVCQFWPWKKEDNAVTMDVDDCLQQAIEERRENQMSFEQEMLFSKFVYNFARIFESNLLLKVQLFGTFGLDERERYNKVMRKKCFYRNKINKHLTSPKDRHSSKKSCPFAQLRRYQLTTDG